MRSPKVAVIGSGVTGLAALKNLLEEGFNATAFESRGTIGGLWKYTSDGDVVSVLETTSVPAFPTAAQVQSYLEAYAAKHDLLSHIRLRVKVLRITRSHDNQNWTVHFQEQNGPETAVDFDKVVICTGEWGRPRIPSFAGRDLFKGEVIHSREFKNPSEFKGKVVVVLGIGNNAADIATSLVGHASKIYLSHRGGVNLLPRNVDSKPGDLAITRRINALKYALNAISPALSERFFNTVIQSLTNKAFKLQPEWRIHPPNSMLCHQPTISDTLCTHLSDASILSTHGIQEFAGPATLRFTDGTTAEDVDTVIYCTGFTRDSSLIPSLSTTNSVDPWSSKPNSDGQPLQRLYQNIFPPSHADSIAFLNNFTYPTGFMWIADLASMAVTQVWKGASQLPPEEEMEREIDRHHTWLTALAERETVASGFVEEESWLRWCHGAAGTGMNENLGYGVKGWGFWMRDMRLSGLLMGGVETPFALRLFEGKRRKWDGAKEAIVDVNREVSRI